MVFGAILLHHQSVFFYFDDYAYATLSYSVAVPGVTGTNYGLLDILSFCILHWWQWGGRVLFYFFYILASHIGPVSYTHLKTVNVYKFTRNFWHKKYIPLLEIYLDTQDKTSYYELPLGGLIYFQNDDIQIVNVPAECWKEVDDENDLKRAEKWFQLNDRACKQNESIYDRD